MKTPFDSLAEGYDSVFSDSLIGKAQRAAVHEKLASRFLPGQRVLDLGCGTGEDALFLASLGVQVVGLDASVKMVEQARAKARQAGLDGLLEFRACRMEDVCGGNFDGAYSNFGAVNCVDNLGKLAQSLVSALKPDAALFLCMMGPYAPWEWAWFLREGNFSKALRRLHPEGAVWRDLRVHYPAIRQLQRAFGMGFQCVEVSAIGALLPPSYAEEWAKQHPVLLAALSRLERRFASVWPLPSLADHYLMELVRR